MPDNRDWGRATEKLEELTRTGELAWTITQLRREEIAGDGYTTKFKGKTIAVYEYKDEEYVHHLDRFESSREVAIEFVTDDGTLEWTWPQTPYRWALIEAIRYQLSRAADFFDELLAD